MVRWRAVLHDLWTLVAGLLALGVALAASAHAVLHKRDVRAALGWVAIIWFAPAIGAAAYLVFGVNRIRRRAQALRLPDVRARPEDLPPPARLPPAAEHLRPLVQLADAIVRRPLVAGNSVELLEGGAQVYPAMLAAIDAAELSVTFCTYIFDPGLAGDAFVEALARARERGVHVRVLIDAIGVRYRWPPIHRRLRKRGIRTELFLPRLTPAWLPFVNLRNHRKLLVVDGRIGFTGGMNVRDDFLPGLGRPAPYVDMQARLEGPVVAHLQSAFAEDWLFTAGEPLEGNTFFPPLPAAGPVIARGVPDGPDEDFETIRWLLLGALAAARSRVRIVTPYFLPDATLVTALNVAALRGVEVDVVLPARSNLPVVHWAQTAQLWQVLERGCRVWFTPPPFDHTKAMTVDGAWSLLGSANWDPRSLRLNFEFDVEAYDPDLATRVDALVDARLAVAKQVTLEEVDRRALALRLRDGVARLFSPYL
ncbi:phospholipase D-like domain-containing protein [Anaeromyxobacter oryzae]|uniref:Cardiolipin synthase n=1 Tax=Anaeromyxobacter oryzae TaxID=2918170 RepID=A0ABM7WV59_9BACT|nr:phospholipase D-like domain-containing protein [Anaeromyxobacter oryzae]BDG03379.1 cardiolipin synthase [Anaeromyxobacter oryzae]